MNFSSAMTDSNEGKSDLRLLREAAGFTRAELGNRIGVSERQIYDWENGVQICHELIGQLLWLAN
jgi:transcriptional regulator with XRE-family HTH domain